MFHILLKGHILFVFSRSPISEESVVLYERIWVSAIFYIDNINTDPITACTHILLECSIMSTDIF